MLDDHHLSPHLKRDKKKKKKQRGDTNQTSTQPADGAAERKKDRTKKKDKKKEDRKKDKKKKRTRDDADDLVHAATKKASPPVSDGGSGPKSSDSGFSAAAAVLMPHAAHRAFCAEHNIEVSGRGADAFRAVEGFEGSGFTADILATTRGFTRPTPIQAVCWPIVSAPRDVVGVAETGSGKTLAFFLPALAANVGSSRTGAGLRILILEPTRELAMQTESVCAKASAACGLSSVCLYGGVPKPPQIKAIRDGATVAVATPGRLLDLANEGIADLGSIQTLVLDEADRMLDMGFERDVRTIVGMTPTSRLTVMFTATWPDSVRELASDFLRDPIRVNVGSEALSANHRVTQHVEVVEQEVKETKLLGLLRKNPPSKSNKVLVFALYKKEAARVDEQLRRKGFNCVAIHGDATQAARTAALDEFKSGRVPLLVATDVAARGLDIPLVEIVINYTFPLTTEDYVHRIGRTGRGGRMGVSYTFFTQHDKAHAGALQNVLREAGQQVPDDLLKFGSAVKKKEHKMYGAFAGDTSRPMKAATRIVFD